MIESYSYLSNSQLCDLLRKEQLQNPYLYIDVNTYGFDGENIHTYLLRQDQQIVLVIYQYYNSLQLLVNNQTPPNGIALQNLANFLDSKKSIMVSGLTSIITSLKSYLCGYRQVNGHLFQYQAQVTFAKESFPFRWAQTPQEFNRLATFISTDPDIGSHYTVAQLTHQLVERHEKYGCQNVFLEKDGQIIAHGGTYASYKDVAVIGGILTDPSQRGKGIARGLVSFLSEQCIVRFKQQPVLYCYNPALFRFYNTCGYQIIYNCAKLELIGDKDA